jgi:hypothetical protein
MPEPELPASRPRSLADTAAVAPRMDAAAEAGDVRGGRPDVDQGRGWRGSSSPDRAGYPG